MDIKMGKEETLSKLLDLPIEWIELSNNQGMSARFLNYGAILLSLMVPDALGLSENVVMTYDDPKDFIKNPLYLNAVIGPNAGRLSEGQLKICDRVFSLPVDRLGNNLHSGQEGLHQQLWMITGEMVSNEACSVVLKYVHGHLQGGYPGNIVFELAIELNDDNELKVTHRALADRDCHINTTNHTYFNLSGNEKHKIDEHLLFVNADYFYNLDEKNCPIQEKVHVKGSAFDFRQLTPILSAYKSKYSGIDHPFSLDDAIDKGMPQVIYKDPVSGRVLEITTNQSDVVIYTNNISYKNHYGICFEAQKCPNTLNIVDAGIKYVNEIKYAFKIQK
ncbi:MAG: hypothetical protein BGO41_02595 [Clostridiales bacterium 38-18]|nr:MAG: hypothetical protein BGO41_02595 [Clostridiales bacterium 38-18]